MQIFDKQIEFLLAQQLQAFVNSFWKTKLFKSPFHWDSGWMDMGIQTVENHHHRIISYTKK